MSEDPKAFLAAKFDELSELVKQANASAKRAEQAAQQVNVKADGAVAEVLTRIEMGGRAAAARVGSEAETALREVRSAGAALGELVPKNRAILITGAAACVLVGVLIAGGVAYALWPDARCGLTRAVTARGGSRRSIKTPASNAKPASSPAETLTAVRKPLLSRGAKPKPGLCDPCALPGDGRGVKETSEAAP